MLNSFHGAILIVGVLANSAFAAFAKPNDLTIAIEQNDLKQIVHLLETSPELANQTLQDRFENHLPLGICIRRGNLEFCKLLIEAGADVDGMDLNKMTPLMIAAGDSKTDCVAFLLDNRADVNLNSKDNIHGRNALDFAAKNGNREIVDLLLDHGADLSQSSALEYALHGDHFEVVRQLLVRSADPNHVHAMLVAAERAPLDILEKMIELGGDVNTQHFYGNVLGRAANSLEKTKLLIRHGADVNASKQNGDRALHKAAFVGNVDVAKLLVASGADFDVQKVDGQRPLDIALWRGHLSMVSFLVESGAMPTLHSVITLGQNGEVTDWLSDKPGDLEKPIPGFNGTLPIHTAIRFDEVNALETLLDKGGNPDVCEIDVSALHLSVRYDNLLAAKTLLKHGANVNAKLAASRYGTGLQTPLHFAVSAFASGDRKHSNLQMVELLLKNGADFQCSNELGETPLGIASRSANEDLLDLFGKFQK